MCLDVFSRRSDKTPQMQPTYDIFSDFPAIEIVSFHINGAFVSAVRLRLFEKYINQVKVSCLKKQEVKDAKENMMGY